MPKFHCIHCAQHIDAPDELIGTEASCPSCANTIYVPNLVPNSNQPETNQFDFEALEERNNQRLKKKRIVLFFISIIFLLPVYLILMLAGPIIFVPAVLISLLLANVISDEIVKYLMKKSK